MIITYKKAVSEFGSSYRIKREVEAGRLFQVARGFYSDRRHVDPYALYALKYPNAIVTLDSAFFLHGLTDVVPDKVHLATSRSATRIPFHNVVQHFAKNRLLTSGKETIKRDDVEVPLYSRERMLVELMRLSASMPLDYYSELIRAYRKISEELDMHAVEQYIELFERKDYMFDILQREVL